MSEHGDEGRKKKSLMGNVDARYKADYSSLSLNVAFINTIQESSGNSSNIHTGNNKYVFVTLLPLIVSFFYMLLLLFLLRYRIFVNIKVEQLTAIQVSGVWFF